MISTLVFATSNLHKLEEVRLQLGDRFQVKGLGELGIIDELPETMGTIPGNAMQKARYIRDKYGLDCFSDDSGLEVDALFGRPGVDTAHYAGTRNATDNMRKVLQELRQLGSGAPRTARFRAVFALCLGKEEQLFEGIVEGRIANEMAGSGGFGYDPIFIPEGYEHTFAQLSSEVKQRFSHRARAVEAMMSYLGER